MGASLVPTDQVGYEQEDVLLLVYFLVHLLDSSVHPHGSTVRQQMTVRAISVPHAVSTRKSPLLVLKSNVCSLSMTVLYDFWLQDSANAADICA